MVSSSCPDWNTTNYVDKTPSVMIVSFSDWAPSYSANDFPLIYSNLSMESSNQYRVASERHWTISDWHHPLNPTNFTIFHIRWCSVWFSIELLRCLMRTRSSGFRSRYIIRNWPYHKEQQGQTLLLISFSLPFYYDAFYYFAIRNGNSWSRLV